MLGPVTIQTGKIVLRHLVPECRGLCGTVRQRGNVPRRCPGWRAQGGQLTKDRTLARGLLRSTHTWHAGGMPPGKQALCRKERGQAGWMPSRQRWSGCRLEAGDAQEGRAGLPSVLLATPPVPTLLSAPQTVGSFPMPSRGAGALLKNKGAAVRRSRGPPPAWGMQCHFPRMPVTLGPYALSPLSSVRK